MFNETEFGFEYKSSDHIVFFGKKNCFLQTLQHIYPHFEFRMLKQTHSDILIGSTTGSDLIEADAHWTAEKNIALVVKTADCIPALIYDPKKEIALAIHAGWRGVENQITKKSLEHIRSTKDFKIYLGPHIQKQSFECDLDVKNKLDSNSNYSIQKNNKFYIDLKSILLSQINLTAHVDLNLDTVTDLNFNSYRRDKSDAGRNLSFIAKV
jgi:polyphenol oxidase